MSWYYDVYLEKGTACYNYAHGIVCLTALFCEGLADFTDAGDADDADAEDDGLSSSPGINGSC